MGVTSRLPGGRGWSVFAKRRLNVGGRYFVKTWCFRISTPEGFQQLAGG